MDTVNGTEDENNMKFVQLIEQQQVILSKSQLPEIKKQKQDPILELIPKWTEISGKTLNVATFKKKLHNMKSRTSLTAADDKRILNDWQKKLLKLTGCDVAETMKASSNSDTETVPASSTSDDVVAIGKRKAEDYLNSLESDATKFMNEEQLKRCLMLKQIKLFDLQISKLENDSIGVALGDSVIDVIEWNVSDENCLVEENEKREESGETKSSN